MIWLCVLLALGCSKENVEPVKPRPPRQSLLIGLVPEQSMFKQIERYEPLARYLSARTGLDIKLTVLPRYEQILSSFAARKMDAAFFGSFTYVLAHARLGVQVLARPVGPDGASTYRGLIFVRKNSGIKSISDMKGKRFVFVDRATTAGYLLPLVYFKEAGVHYESYFKESYFAGTHEDAIYDVLDRKADIGAAKSTVFERLAATDKRIKNELLVLLRSSEAPESSFAVRSELDASVKEKLKAALLTMHEDPEGAGILRTFGAQRFIETTDSDFRPVYEFARAIGIDLRTWSEAPAK
jgi:phosphonate transport system substrate-binding protein